MGTLIVQVLLVVCTVTIVGYAIRTAWFDYENTPTEVCHKFDGKPRLETACYSAEFDRRSDARRYARELRKQPLVTDVTVRKNSCM